MSIFRVTDPVWKVQCDMCSETLTIVGKSLHSALQHMDEFGWIRRREPELDRPMRVFCDRCQNTRAKTSVLARPAGAPR